MANWNSIQQEIIAEQAPEAADIVRRRKIDRLVQVTGRPLVIYAVDFMTSNPIKAQVAGGLMLIDLQDKDGFDEVTQNLPGPTLDVLLHSPGGSAEATESIVALLRSRYTDIRFIIPQAAKSAATMLAMSGNQLLMDARSELGPTDPQMIMVVDNRQVAAPAQAIKDQFETAQEETSNNPDRLPAWLPILRMYGPSLLAQCDNHLALAEELVAEWLQSYMFAGDADAEGKAARVAQYLSNHNNFRSHGRRVGIDALQRLDVNILDLRTDSTLHTAVRDLYTALALTFLGSDAYKIFENSQHEALVQSISFQVHQSDPSSQPPQPTPPQPTPPQPAAPAPQGPQRPLRGRDR